MPREYELHQGVEASEEQGVNPDAAIHQVVHSYLLHHKANAEFTERLASFGILFEDRK